MPIVGTGKGGQGLDYNVDIVMCIDATGSMDSIISNVKANALSFYQKFVDQMEVEGKSVQQLRIKVIAFRDYGCDAQPMEESKFFVLGEGGEDEAFRSFVDGIEACGGGDTPENSLEALALAIKSDWVNTGAVRRHVIIMYSDAPALPLGARSDKSSYPAGMPASLAELREWWEGQYMEKRAKRLLVFAPDVEPWSDMVDWTGAFHTASQAGNGCDDTDIETCIKLLVKSI